ncbi:asparaginase [Jatrophihabitans telluris]|uniref:Asparaginase n=1 Tax=Jatrophihabitans telluris TaxID=2038343 RepID=A0ABY4QXF5_9ACTN|nr:asparaginase [Jatrophihabitans telluris]UQX88264.1 asparaginase [Jatrophihabitans telluris]
MIRIQPGPVLVEVERSGVVESVHTGHVIVLDADGTVRSSTGDPDQPIFGRSSLKPLQAVGLLRAGHPSDDLSEVALAAASHSGSDEHLRRIEAALNSDGLTEQDLECPPDLPIGLAERRKYLTEGRSERRLAMNCSGKHTAMLRTSLRNRWPISGYLAPDHPLQAHLAATVAQLCGEPVAATGVDGCGAPLFGLSLSGIARAFSRMASATGGELHTVAEAMRQYPDLVGGSGRAVTRLMQGVPGLIAKDGAEGVFAAALPDGGAVALKIDDGAERAAQVAVVAALRQLGVSGAALDELGVLEVLGGGSPVGRIRPALPLRH